MLVVRGLRTVVTIYIISGEKCFINGILVRKTVYCIGVQETTTKKCRKMIHQHFGGNET